MSSGQERLFGTDGIRGEFGRPPLERTTLARTADALCGLLSERRGKGPTVVIGGDTRESTPQIVGWLTTALERAGARVICLGVTPTPAVAFLVPALGADAGIVVSASHNPFADNGVKILDHRGFKLSDDDERELERRVNESQLELPSSRRAKALESDSRHLIGLYLRSLSSSLEGAAPLAGLSVVLDTGHGAASAFAESVFSDLGARCHVMNAAPDGRNINEGCGSTAPELAARAVVEHRCDLGFAFDGDADRVIFCDHRGVIRDGDEILYLWARSLKRRGTLGPPSIVATSMSNLGLERALAPLGIAVVRCDVGDRQVVATLQERGLRLGGEQSGHIIDLERSTTGDGLLTALQVAEIVCRERTSVAELLSSFVRFPQILQNVQVSTKPPLEDLPRTKALSKSIEQELGAEGRLVLRYSGTEPLARIMIEGPRLAEIEDMAQRLETVLLEETTGC